MRSLTRSLPTVLLLAACGGEQAGSIEGTLAEGVEATHVWMVGQPERALIADGAFQLERVAGEIVDLRFASDDRELGRMEIREVSGRSRLTLHDIWIDDEVAYPADAVAEGGGVVTVNSIRYGSLGRETMQLHGTVLAASRDEDALLVRPADETLPDLRVVITPATEIRTPDGDPVPLRVEFGDSVQVSGSADGGYLIGSEIVVPRRSGRSSARESTPARTSASRSATPVRNASAPAVVRTPPTREAAKGKENRGKGRGNERGKGRGRGS